MACQYQTPTFSALRRRDFLRLGLGALAGFSLVPACTPAEPLKLALQPWCGYQFIFLAQQEGWLPTGRLQLLETQDTADSLSALKEGRVDGAALTLDEVLLLRDQGMDLVVVMVFDISAGADVVLAKPDIKALTDLKGKRIGVESSGLGTIMLSQVLKAAGLERAELTIVPMSYDHVEAWRNSRLEALLTYEPALSTLKAQEGLTHLFDSRKLPQIILDVLAVRPAAARLHASALRSALAGHFRALHLWRTNPIDTAYRLSARLNVPPAQVGNVLRGLDLPDALYNREYLTAPSADLTDSVKQIAAIMTAAQLLKHETDITGLFVPDYLPEEN